MKIGPLHVILSGGDMYPKVPLQVPQEVPQAAPLAFGRDTKGKIGLSFFELKSPGNQARKAEKTVDLK